MQCFGALGEIPRVTVVRSSKEDIKTESAFIKFAEQEDDYRAFSVDVFWGGQISKSCDLIFRIELKVTPYS